MMLKVDSLSYHIKDKVLLHSLSLALKKGDNLTILGANGAGKSTLAKLLCGLIESRQSIRLKEHYIETIKSTIRADYINYIPSRFSLYDPYITVDEYLNLSRYKKAVTAQKRHDILSLLGLLEYQKSLAKELSSGEQQLLQIASGMIQNAQITIFDEPTSNLDPKKTKIVFDILQKSHYLKQKILITHDLNLAYKLGYPILYLDDGKATYYHDNFFSKERLRDHFGDTIMIVDDYVVEIL